MKAKKHGVRKQMRLKAVSLLHDFSGITLWEDMALIRMRWELAA